MEVTPVEKKSLRLSYSGRFEMCIRDSVYSNPNNPSWICLKEEELRIIGELATQYDVIVSVSYTHLDVYKRQAQ